MFPRIDNWLLTQYRDISKVMRRCQYLRRGQSPWTTGYLDYRNDFLRNALGNPRLCELFKQKQELPRGYGSRLDERVVEYPGVISKLIDGETHLLDAGSTLNFPFLLRHAILGEKIYCRLHPCPGKDARQSERVVHLRRPAQHDSGGWDIR